MLRMQSDDGWWLITHPDHARLAAAFASHWGNSLFAPPRPRDEVLKAIEVHDDGWAKRDAHPCITRQGKPSAFSVDLVGKYSAFEEIDLADYLSVRESALDQVEAHCAYAALIVSMHTYDLLSFRADRSTIARDQLTLLDEFLERQRMRQKGLHAYIRAEARFSAEEVSEKAVRDNFCLLQAVDNLSLLSCVTYMQSANLLHPLATRAGGAQAIDVTPIAPRTFRLAPYPFDQDNLTFELPARHVNGLTFATAEELDCKYHAATVEMLTVKVSV